ncbi:hypothetical protein DV735_g262, partial [Chaetothyriales sp. CBS 134920]
MASGADRFKQDLVVSIRYRNDLPPPPMPPKLLDIDTGGIQQYLTTSYASSLARREMPNIEADAEGGMPIDMEKIKRHVQKGFDIAYPESIPYNPPETRSQPATQAEREAWRKPKHPTNRNAVPVSYYPIIPDLETGTDLSGWCRFKFDKVPLAPNRAARDNRIDVASFFTVPDKTLEQAWLAKNEAWKKEPELYEDPGPQPHKFSLHIPRRPEDVPRIKKHLFAGHPRADDPELLAGLVESNEGVQGVPYDRARVYPTVEQINMDPQRFMAIGLYDPPSSTRPSSPPSEVKQAQGPAAYYYPINENVRLRADRKLADFGSEEAEDLADVIYVAPTEPTARQVFNRHDFRGRYDRQFAGDFKKMAEAVEAEEKRELEALENERADLAEPDEMDGVEQNGHANNASPANDDDMHDH